MIVTHEKQIFTMAYQEQGQLPIFTGIEILNSFLKTLLARVKCITSELDKQNEFFLKFTTERS